MLYLHPGQRVKHGTTYTNVQFNKSCIILFINLEVPISERLSLTEEDLINETEIKASFHILLLRI